MSQPTEYVPTQWQDSPSTATPITATRLNKLEQGVLSASQVALAATTPAEAQTLAQQLVQALRTELLGGAQAGWDTLQELKALLDASDAGDDAALAELMSMVQARLTKADADAAYEQRLARANASAGQVPILQTDGTLKLGTVAGGGSAPDATSTTNGLVRLTGHLGGTADNPTVTRVYSKSDVGLGNVDNTSDANKPVSSATQNALTGKADLVSGVVPTSQIPALALTTGVAVASRSAMLALTSAQVQPGDFAVVAADPGRGTYVLQAADPSQLSNWLLLNAPTDVVQSVNGQNGLVVLGKSDVGLGNVDNTSDANKPISTATGTALAAKKDAAVSTARRWFSGSQSAASGSVGSIALNTTDFMRGSTVTASGGDLQVTAAGVYLVSAEVSWTGGSSGNRTGLIQVNGSTVREFGTIGTDARIAGTAVLILAVNDVVRLGYYSTGGATISGAASKDVGLTVAQLGV